MSKVPEWWVRCIRNSAAVAETTGPRVRPRVWSFNVVRAQSRGSGSPALSRAGQRLPRKGLGIPGVYPEKPLQMVKSPFFSEVPVQWLLSGAVAHPTAEEAGPG